MPRRGVETGRLTTRAPFHLEATVRVLQRRPANLVDNWIERRYLRALPTLDGLALVDVENRGTIDAPNVRFSIRGCKPPSATRSQLVRTVREVLGLDIDPEPLQRLAEAESRLRPTAHALRGMRPRWAAR